MSIAKKGKETNEMEAKEAIVFFFLDFDFDFDFFFFLIFVSEKKIR
jgi:hypothetical protein